MQKVTSQEIIAAMYAGLYQRAPDLDGLVWWERQVQGADDLATFEKMGAGFAHHPAFEDLYGSMDSGEFIRHFYINVSGYAGDEAGIGYWTGQLDRLVAGGVDQQQARGTIAADMIYGLLNADLTSEAFPSLSDEELESALKRQSAVQNKADAALYYVQTLGKMSDFSPGMDLTDPATVMKSEAWHLAREAIAGVTDDPQSLERAKSTIEKRLLPEAKEAAESAGISSGVDREKMLSIDSPLVKALDSGDYWDRNDLSYSFNQEIPSDYDERDLTNEWSAFTEDEEKVTGKLLDDLSQSVDLHFTQVPDQDGDLRFNHITPLDDAAGFAYYPNAYDAIGGDIFLDNLFKAKGALDPGSNGYDVLLHEVGHALGLKHPFEGGNVLPKTLDNTDYTVMSYTFRHDWAYISTIESRSDGNGGKDFSIKSHAEYTGHLNYGILDMAALQAIYGADREYHTGNDMYRLSDMYEHHYKWTLWDAGGVDTLDLSETTHPDIVHLESGTLSSVDYHSIEDQIDILIEKMTEAGWLQSDARSYATKLYVQKDGIYTGEDNLGIAYGVVIENLMTGSGDDVVYDNAADNRIETGKGSDTIYLNAGGDESVDGGPGRDTVYVDCQSAEAELVDEGSGIWELNTDTGTIKLIGVETLQFEDQAVALG